MQSSWLSFVGVMSALVGFLHLNFIVESRLANLSCSVSTEILAQSLKITLKIYQRTFPALKADVDALYYTILYLKYHQHWTTQWGEKLKETFLVCAHCSCIHIFQFVSFNLKLANL